MFGSRLLLLTFAQIRRDREKEEEKKRKQIEKEKKKADAEREKAEKKAQKQKEREEKRATQAQEKADNAAFKKANTLKKDKKALLPSMHILFSDSLLRKHPRLGQTVTSVLKEKHPDANPVTHDASSPFQNYKTIRWKKHHTEKFNLKERQWEVCEEYDEFERTALLWVDGEEIARNLGHLKSIVQEFRSHHNLTRRDDQTFILFHGGCPGVNRDTFDRILAELQMTMHTHHIFCDDLDDSATRLYNLTADLGKRSQTKA